MTVLIRALALHGDPERARYLAQRLAEFHDPVAEAFLAECMAGKIQPPTFRCGTPDRPIDWLDFK
jgi:hypothetical protein